MKNFINKLYWFCFKKHKWKLLSKVACSLIFFVLIIAIYGFYQKIVYKDIQVFKNDIRIETIIKSAFPENYDIEIKKGDLVGLEDKFYIAYGNKQYVKKLFGSPDIKTLESSNGKINYPILKIFYMEESTLWDPILSLMPSFLKDYFLEWRIKELYAFKPIIPPYEKSNILKKDIKTLILDFGNYPYLVPKPISKIEGELYQINRKEILDEIDQFEGAPDYYQREKIRVKTHRGEKIAFVYIRKDATVPEGQEPLKVWQNDVVSKIEKFNNFLERLN